MQFDWTTFILEILNFLVLVWLLKRFLYRPVLDVLDARQERVRAELAQAAALKDEGTALREEYEQRLAHWAQEREQLRRELEQDLTQQRATGMEKIRQAQADEEAKARVRNEALAAAREAELIRQASGAAYANVAAMLRRLASPALTCAIARLLVDDLAAFPAQQRDALRKAAGRLGERAKAEVAAAHALDEATLDAVGKGLSDAAGQALTIAFSLEPALIAGVRIAVGECLLHANLADELAYFRRQDDHA